jgi:predicted DsbA family dithiol-disulfide isomerase
VTQRYARTCRSLRLDCSISSLTHRSSCCLLRYGYAGYIGKKHLNRAINHILRNPNVNAARPVAFSVIRVPFFLEPHYDENKPYIESNRDRLVRKWGGREGWERQKLNHDLRGRGLEAGIPHFNLDRLAANSMASHRLVQMIGKTYGLNISEAIYDFLNVYYFVDGHSLNDKPKLAAVVAERLEKLLALSPNNVQPPSQQSLLYFLNGTEGRQEIEEAVRTLHELGIHGIPKFIIEGTTVVDGAARPEVFINIFRDIETRGALKGSPVFGSILGLSSDVIQRGSHCPSELVA